MPIYEFECLSCSERFDRLQKLSDPDPDSCPNCGATGVRRRLTAPAFRLSGSGWYETDFKKEGDKKRNLTEKSEGSQADAKTSDAKVAEAKSGEAKSGDKGGDGKPPAGKVEPAGKGSGTKSAEPAKAAESGKSTGKADAS